MRKILAVTMLILCACKKENNNITHKSFYGKWFYIAAINKEYTVDNGDTSFTRNDTTWYNGADYIDFTQQGVALVFSASNQQTDSLRFEEITPVFFRLDSLLCEATTIADSSLQYNSLDFSYNETPKVKVTQIFYTLKR